MEIRLILIGGDIYWISANSQFDVQSEEYTMTWNIWKFEICRVATRPSIMPYNDVTIIEEVQISLKQEFILKNKGKTIASLKANALHKMYRLQQVEVKLTKQFLENLFATHPKSVKIIKCW